MLHFKPVLATTLVPEMLWPDLHTQASDEHSVGCKSLPELILHQLPQMAAETMVIQPYVTASTQVR